MRVVHITPLHFGESGYFGGGERYVQNVVKALNRFQHESVRAEIVSFCDAVREPPVVDDPYAPTIFIPDDAAAGPFNSVSRDLWRVLSDDVDIVHVHQPLSRTGTIAVLTAAQRGRRIAITDTGFDNTDSLLNKWAGLNLVDRIICISEFSASFFRAYGKITPVEVVRGPVDEEFFAAHRPLRRKHNQILCVARILPHKAIDLIIKALPPGVELIVCGRIYDLNYYNHLRWLAADKRVAFITDADDDRVLELYRSSVATILASQFIDCYGRHYNKPELMGLTLLESMSVGTPVICSRVGPMPELIAGPDTGLIFENLEDLAAILEKVKKAKWPPPDAAESCIAHVRANFDLAAVSDKLASIYSRMRVGEAPG